MPCLCISTNVCLDGTDINPVFSEATKIVSQIIGKPENGSVNISFEGNKEPAAYAEVISMGGINSVVKRKLIDQLGELLQKR
ncbi:hypothetical protein RJ641_024522, partial [Dillenia turbinata]